MYFTLILTFLAVFRVEIFGAAPPPIRIAVSGQKGINSVRVHDKISQKYTAVYHTGNTKDMPLFLLLTHHSREFSPLKPSRIIAPQAAASLISETNGYWKSMASKRFHYYSQQSTKVFTKPINVNKWVKDGDEIVSGRVKFQVMATPGYTRGAVSYLAVLDGKRCAFTGELMYGDGICIVFRMQFRRRRWEGIMGTGRGWRIW